MTHITQGDSYYGTGVTPGVTHPHRRDSYNFCRTFLPSVHIDGGGGRRLFFYFTIMMFERFTLTYFPRFSITITTQSLELSFSNLTFIHIPHLMHSIASPESGSFTPSFLTLFASPVFSYGGDATLTLFS